MMTDTERAISFFENARENCVMVARKPFETALATLRRTAEDDKAREEGRLVELPCKVGDTVKVDARTWGNVWNYKTIERGEFLLGEIVSIIKTKKQLLMKIRVEHNVGWKRPMKRYPVGAIGITVFLTRQEAEAALGGGEGD